MPQTLLTLDLSPSELEVEVSKSLRSTLGERGLDVKHNGTSSSHAPGGKPDIEMSNADVHVIVEVTKLTRVAQSNNEATPVPAHLDQVKAKNPGKRCFALFVSPSTFDRTSSLFSNHNHAHSHDPDQKIACLDFAGFDLLTEWLDSDAGANFQVADLVELLNGLSSLATDLDRRAFLNDGYLHRPSLAADIRRIEADRLAAKYSRLDGVFKKIHKDLRSVCGLGPAEAFHELSKLIFLKMSEEQFVAQASLQGRIVENRYSTKYIQETRAGRRPNDPEVHPLVAVFERDRDRYVQEGLFDAGETIAVSPGMDEGSYVDQIVAATEEFSFIDPDAPFADIKGMIYEQFLGLSLKNTDLGQYFTPQAVIDFLVEAASLTTEDIICDPACGTGRFLVHAMGRMLELTDDPQAQLSIRSAQLVGAEMSPYVAKIAKMNMFVHGDGRTNIYRQDSIGNDLPSQHRPTLILTNPPLGDVNFLQLIGPYEDVPAWYEGMEVIPKRRRTNRRGDEKVDVTRSNLKGGALFINRFVQMLGDSGRAYTVIDDAILNTDDYSPTREFLRREFRIEAVVSLTEDAFKHASGTATKTSLLLLHRRDPHQSPVQDEPIFFAHAARVGVNAKGRPCPNDLVDPGRDDDILRALQRFRCAVDAASTTGAFVSEDFSFPSGSVFESGNGESSIFFAVLAGDIEDRLEFKWYSPALRSVRERLDSIESVSLASITDSELTTYGLTASGQEVGDIAFINIENLSPTGVVDPRGIRYVDSTVPAAKDIAVGGDILISRSRLPGIAAVVSAEDAGMAYGSYIIRFHLSEEGQAAYLPEYVALMINSVLGQVQVERLKSGSNGYNINTPQLGSLMIPAMPLEEQRVLVHNMRLQREAADELRRTLASLRELGDMAVVSAALLGDEEGARSDDASEDEHRSVEEAVKEIGRSLGALRSELQASVLASSEGMDDVLEAKERLAIRASFGKSL